MSTKYQSEEANFRVGLKAAADRWNTDPATDIFDMRKYGRIAFYVMQADATAGTANPTITVEASSDNAGAGAVAIAFRSRKQTDIGTVGALTETAAAGVALTAGDDQTLIAEVRPEDLPDGKPWVRVVATEGANDPAVGCISVVMDRPRYTDGNPESAL